MKPKYDPAVYVALSNAGMSNRVIAKQLGVSEAAVRRGLLLSDATTSTKTRRFVLTVEEL